jgi:alkanesulfonate monooxygenase SsuD/methylene tetrahydromethanopterin reductase-like flavin-dependent oxidoreductase (luciferase family)
MDVPRPTVAPPGRLVRLGVVLDTRNPIERLLEVARMCDRAGIGALWVEDVEEEARLDAWTALALLAGEVRRARIGVVLDAGAWPVARLARMAATVGALTGGRFELTLRAGADQAVGAVTAFREALASTTVPATLAPSAEEAAAGPPVPLAAGPAYGAIALPAEPPTLGVQVAPAGGPAAPPPAAPPLAAPPLAAPPPAAPPPAAPSSAAPSSAAPGRPAAPLAKVIADVDDLVLATAPLAGTLAAAGAARRAAAEAGRAQGTLGVAARLPVSVGRTSAEAQARWEAEPAFAALGDSEQAGLFGTLEQCHDRVVALAHAGVSDLRCLLPNAIDIHDVIAQLTAMTIGTADKLVPGAPRTRVPEPPTGWGGRSRFPRPS